MTVEQADSVGRGRVWTGRQGKENGLVDELGDLEAAIQLARDKAGIPAHQKIRVVTYMKRPRLRDLFSFGLPWGSRGSQPVGGSGVLLSLIDGLGPLIHEDALFLAPWLCRIR